MESQFCPHHFQYVYKANHWKKCNPLINIHHFFYNLLRSLKLEKNIMFAFIICLNNVEIGAVFKDL